MSCMPALLGPMGGSRLLVVAVHEGRPNTQRALSGRPRTDQAIAKSFSFLARLELGEDLPCLTVDDDECLQGAEPFGDPRHDGWAVCPMLTKRGRNTVGSGPIERALSRFRQNATHRRRTRNLDNPGHASVRAGMLREPVQDERAHGVPLLALTQRRGDFRVPATCEQHQGQAGDREKEAGTR